MLVKVFLGLSNYATKKELEHPAAADTSNLAAKNDFIPSKAEVDKLDINKLANVSTGLNNLKTNVNNFHVGRLKTFTKDLKKLSDAKDKEVVKKQCTTH